MVSNQVPISPMCPMGPHRWQLTTVSVTDQLLATSGFRCSAKNFSIAV
jgi:hypothetical protein